VTTNESVEARSVTDPLVVALTVGPRNRQRLRTGGIAVAVVAAGAFAVLAISHRSSGGSGPVVTGDQRRSTPSSSRATHLVYGMTPREVQHFAGRPQKVRGGCWYYEPVHGKVGLLTTGFPGTPSMTADQIKLCFYSGVLSFEYSHLFTPQRGWGWSSAAF
jgi:hypothetical protein